MNSNSMRGTNNDTKQDDKKQHIPDNASDGNCRCDNWKEHQSRKLTHRTRCFIHNFYSLSACIHHSAKGGLVCVWSGLGGFPCTKKLVRSPNTVRRSEVLTSLIFF